MLPRTLLIAAVVLSADIARADLITPDSISPAPTGLVTDQYKGLGLVFTSSWAGGVGSYYSSDGWRSYTLDTGMPAGIQSVSFVMPGTGVPATTDSIRVRLFSNFDAVFTLTGYDGAGNQIGSRDVLVGESSDNWLTLRASRMHSFAIVSNWPPSPFAIVWPPGPIHMSNSPDYGIEAIEFHPVPAVPEPGSLTLFAIGSLVLAGRVGHVRSGG